MIDFNYSLSKEEIGNIFLETAAQLGVEYGDIRIQKTTNEIIYIKKLSIMNASNSIINGYGIRILKNGAWGFSHSNVFTKKAVVETTKKAYEIANYSSKIKKGKGIILAHERSYIDTYITKIETNPFDIPLKDKVDLFLEVNKILLNYEQIKDCYFGYSAQEDDKYFVSTIGSKIKSTIYHIYPSFAAFAVTDKDAQSRSFNPGAIASGWEFIENLNLLDKAPQIAEEAIMKANADTLNEERRMDLILDHSNLSLTMHESVGHPTELDRVLGWEADFAGISFATPEKLKNYRYGSEIVNFVADNTLEKGLATTGYDDDGVPNQKWYIIKDGILNEYGTTRETAPFIGEKASRGCNRATFYYDMPINRIPNLYLEPGKKELTPQDLISDTEDGIYIEGQGSFSIDQHRVNFQFGGDLFWEIKKGKKTRMLKKVLYKSNNPEFWNSCDAICDKRFFKTFGVNNCGKGQPMQSGRMTHGASIARFRNIRVGGSQ